jgi:hypothetical protein
LIINLHLSGILKKHFPTFSLVRGWDLRIFIEIFFNLGFDSLGFCASDFAVVAVAPRFPPLDAGILPVGQLGRRCVSVSWRTIP